MECVGNEKEAFVKFQILYSEYQHQIFFIFVCNQLNNYEQDDTLQEICDQIIQKDPKNQIAWTYNGIKCFRKFKFGQGSLTIADQLIAQNPSNIFGYIIKGANLIYEINVEQTTKLCNFLKQKFPQALIVNLMECFNLFLQQKYQQSYYLLKEIPDNFFGQKIDKFHLEIITLLNYLNFAQAIQTLFQCYEDSQLFYIAFNDICDQVEKQGASHYIVCLLKGYKAEVSQKTLGFYHILKGRLLFIKGKTERDILLVNKALVHFTNYQYDTQSQPYINYYKGQALLYSNKLDEAINYIEKALHCNPDFLIKPFQINQYICVCKLMQGHFEQALKYFQEADTKTKDMDYGEIGDILLGVIYFIKGQNQQAQAHLNKVILNFPLSQFFLSWILKEQNKNQQAEQLLFQLKQEFPLLHSFVQKYTFLSVGPYSNYIQKHFEKFDTYDNKIFYAIKFVAFYIEVKGYQLGLKFYQINFAMALVKQLAQNIHKINSELQQQLLKKYPFV